MNVTLRQVRVFVAVAKAGSFTGAAEQLCLTQSTLTKSVRELETGIGLRLFERTTRRLNLTAAGKAFLPVARRLLKEFEASIVDLRQQADGQRGTVEICCGTALSTTVLPTVIKEMRQRYPNIRIQLVDDTSGGAVRRVASGEVDFGFCSLVGAAGVPITAHKLLTARLGVLFPRDYRPVPPTVTAAMLGELPLIKDAEESSIIDALRRHQPEGFELAGDITASNLATQFSLVRAGIGPCILSALAASHPAADAYPYRLIEDPELFRELYVIYRKRDPVPPAGQTFLDVLFAMLPTIAFRPGVTLAGHP